MESVYGHHWGHQCGHKCFHGVVIGVVVIVVVSGAAGIQQIVRLLSNYLNISSTLCLCCLL